MVNKRLVLISGASRGIGKSFLDRYRTLNNTMTIGISRTGNAGQKLDLEDRTMTNAFIESLNFSNVGRIIYMHSIGIDKFEPYGRPEIDEDGDGIDDEVRTSNLTTFLNLFRPLIYRAKKEDTPLTICSIGSISDAFEVPYWQSFSRTKNEVRRICKSMSRGNVKCLFLNVGSTLDDEGRTYGRKYADTRYWQTSRELVDKSFGIVDGFQESPASYAEFDFFKPNPSFREDYFTNLPELYTIWQKELGYEGRKIPLGIHI